VVGELLLAALPVATFLTTSAVIPPVETAAAAIQTAVAARQNGHMMTSVLAMLFPV